MHGINIEQHGPVKAFNYFGIKALQVYGVHEAFSELAQYVKDKPFDMIIELGADYGGLTNMLADHEISAGAVVHTFDLNKDKFTNLRPEKITFHHTDIYSNFEVIGQLVSNSKRTLVLCDGGNKVLEFNSMVPYLNPGDIIMAHDYAKNVVKHMENIEEGRWNWWEFNDSNIPDAELFIPIECFDKYVWCIREKK